MRSFLVGLFILTMSAVGALAQQAGGEIESVGFQKSYRPNCWVPMIVRLRPEGLATGTYKLQCVQEDLDKDRVTYERTISVTGAVEGQPVKEQRYWMYFVPQATDHGLPDASEGLAAIREKVKVYLTTAAGKPIAQIPMTTTINSIEPYYSPNQAKRGDKLVLAVADAGSGDQPARVNYEDVRGVKEGLVLLGATPGDLPDNVLGFESVDAMIMMDVDPASLKVDDKIAAIRQWVREGGNLVICQNPTWEKMGGWGDLLPVTYPNFGTDEQPLQGAAERKDLMPLQAWARATEAYDWQRLKPPFKVGLAVAKPGALVADEVEWKAADGKTVTSPYLVRAVYGLGSVTWVAQDLGSPLFARVTTGWPFVWDKVFDWKNDTRILPPRTNPGNEQAIQNINEAYGLAQRIDLGNALLGRMDHGGKGAALLFVAVVFFIVYWVVAGPVSYFVLAGKGKAGQSWFVFGLCAIAATVLTVVVVRLVLRGPPQVHHLTVVQSAPQQAAVATSRIGLYIPRDGMQRIELAGTGAGAVSYIVPFPMHPQQMEENQFAAYMEYTVPVRDATVEKPPAIEVPYRSTLKKLEAKWVGRHGGIEGTAKLLPPEDGQVGGQLTNGTGKELQNVYIAFNYPGESFVGGDWVLYLPKWAPGTTVDLNREFKLAALLQDDREPRAVPGLGKTVRGRIGRISPLDWDRYWYSGLRAENSELAYADRGNEPPKAFVMLSLFDRLPTPRNRPEKARFELLRRGARRLDLSGVIAAGGMVVLGETASGLPFPFLVDGDKVEGDGAVYHQAVVPVDRSPLAPATQPSTQAATQ